MRQIALSILLFGLSLSALLQGLAWLMCWAYYKFVLDKGL